MHDEQKHAYGYLRGDAPDTRSDGTLLVHYIYV